jgi:Trk K+ transport system NAD-binding subunit
VSSLTIPKDFKTKKLIDLDWRNKFDINIVLIKKTKGKSSEEELGKIEPIIPKAQELVEPLDIIYVIGSNHDLVTFANALKK